jgi:hypothetical protein
MVIRRDRLLGRGSEGMCQSGLDTWSDVPVLTPSVVT